MEPPREEGTKIYKNDFGQITKMVAMPILENPESYALETWYATFGTQSLKLYINDNPVLNLTYFMARSNKVVYVFA